MGIHRFVLSPSPPFRLSSGWVSRTEGEAPGKETGKTGCIDFRLLLRTVRELRATDVLYLSSRSRDSCVSSGLAPDERVPPFRRGSESRGVVFRGPSRSGVYRRGTPRGGRETYTSREGPSRSGTENGRPRGLRLLDNRKEEEGWGPPPATVHRKRDGKRRLSSPLSSVSTTIHTSSRTSNPVRRLFESVRRPADVPVLLLYADVVSSLVSGVQTLAGSFHCETPTVPRGVHYSCRRV